MLLRNESHITIAPVQVAAGSRLGPAYRGRDLLIPFTAPDTLCFRSILQRQATDPQTVPLQLRMIRSGTTPTYGFTAYDGASISRVRVQGPEPTPVPLEGVYWLTERVLCIRAKRDWVGEVTVGCGYRLTGGRTNVSTTDQRGSGFNYTYLGNSSIQPPLDPPETVMEDYENAVDESGAPINGTPLQNTEFSLVFELKVSAAPA